MQNIFQGSREFARRHELDALAPTRAAVAAPAQLGELGELAAIAKKEIPGVRISEMALEQFWKHDQNSIFAFRSGANLLGGIAFLYLNSSGMDALLLDEIDLTQPSREYLAGAGEEVEAIYVWALAARGRGAVAIANVARFLRGPRFVSADYYAQPSSRDGRALLVTLGFKPIASFQPDLWCYQRPWNRVPSAMQSTNVSVQRSLTRSVADARH